MQDWDAREIVGLLHEYSQNIVCIIAEFFPRNLVPIIAQYSYDNPKIVYEISRMRGRLRFGNVELCRGVVVLPDRIVWSSKNKITRYLGGSKLAMTLKFYNTEEHDSLREIVISEKKAWRALFWQPTSFEHPRLDRPILWSDDWTDNINRLKASLYVGLIQSALDT